MRIVFKSDSIYSIGTFGSIREGIAVSHFYRSFLDFLRGRKIIVNKILWKIK